MLNYESCISFITIKNKAMKNKVKISLLASMLIASVGLFAQGTISRNNPLNNLGKKGAKMMLDSIYTVGWDTSANKYYNKGFTQKFYYDSNGNNILHLTSIFSGPLNERFNFRKYSNTFDKNNKLILEVTSECDDRINWIDIYKIENSYDSLGKKTVVKLYEPNNATIGWYLLNTNHNIYNSNNNIISQIDTAYLYKEISIGKSDFLYDSNGNITKVITKSWINDNWINSRIIENTYLNNKLSENVIKSWNTPINNWINITKTTYNTDNNGEITGINYYNWDNIINQWSNTYRNYISYDNSLLSSDVIWPQSTDFDKSLLKHYIYTDTNQIFISNKWYNNGLQTYYYSPFKASNSTNEVTKTNIIIYPNPTTGIINISTNETIENINIIDVNGKLVHHQTNNSPIDLSQHAKGIYFINITTEKGVVNKKIVLN